jgi:methionyl-tRNA formyltransferase
MRSLRIVFLGTPRFAVPSLEALARQGHEVVLVVAQPARPSGRGLALHSPEVAQAARRMGLPLLQPDRIRSEEVVSAIRQAAPDLGVVVAYGRILPSALLNIPRLGFLNVHASLLPRYRGAAPIQRAIEAGEQVTGVTIMGVDVELDHGPIFAVEETPIGKDEHASELSARLSLMGGDLLVRTLDALPTITPREQDHAAANYASKLEKEEGQVDWSLGSQRIYDRYRAFDPWPGLFVSFRGQALKLRQIEVAEASGIAGRIVSVDGQSVVVGTGDSALRLHRVQLPGRQPVTGGELARSSGLGAGDSFS